MEHSRVIKTLCIFGTRPEAIKMAPVIRALALHPQFVNKLCITGQHREMLDPLLELLGLRAEFDLKVMVKNQGLSYLTAAILQNLEKVFESYRPDWVLVHGDTTTTFAATLSAYYHKIPVAHVEAGLRIQDLFSPWPEEANRKLTGALASLHFAPTQGAVQNLRSEGVLAEKIHLTGNTVVDALLTICQRLDADPALQAHCQQQLPFLKSNGKMILITGHRRESFGLGFEAICKALAMIALEHPTVELVYPVHLNPQVQEPVNYWLSGIKNIHLIPPVDYLQFVYLMKTSYLILTDSGGIQEEAPSLKKPVLLMRAKTERPEAVEAGVVKLVGTEVELICSEVRRLLTERSYYELMSGVANPYGDGHAAERIASILSQHSLFYVKEVLN